MSFGHLAALHGQRSRVATGRPSCQGYTSRVYAATRPHSIIANIPLRTVNPLNRRDHWAVKAKRAKRERGTVKLWLRSGLPLLPVTVWLTRLGPRAMDTDGLAASFKAIRDGIQDAYGVDDGSDLFVWKYEQEKSKTYGVRIEVSRVAPAGGEDGQ